MEEHIWLEQLLKNESKETIKKVKENIEKWKTFAKIEKISTYLIFSYIVYQVLQEVKKEEQCQKL